MALAVQDFGKGHLLKLVARLASCFISSLAMVARSPVPTKQKSTRPQAKATQATSSLYDATTPGSARGLHAASELNLETDMAPSTDSTLPLFNALRDGLDVDPRALLLNPL